MQKITEGQAVIRNETAKVVSRDLPVFYNPVMQHNRDVSLLVLQAENRALQIGDVLAGSGVRAIRFLKECPECVSHITINDCETKERIATNLKENSIEYTSWSLQECAQVTQDTDAKKDVSVPRVVVMGSEASQLLLASTGFEYIEIDPFGTPNPFLDAACKRISRNGILAVTATDTSALAASYPDACERKYWATPCEGERKHEVGLRILIRKVQLVGMQYDKALEPLLVYNKDHYYRAYFRCVKGKQKCNAVFAQHGQLPQEPHCGPLWTGTLCDVVFVKKMLAKCTDEKITLFLETIVQENSLAQPAQYHYINDINRELEKKKLPTTNKEELALLFGENMAPTHHDKAAFKSIYSHEEILKKLQKR